MTTITRRELLELAAATAVSGAVTAQSKDNQELLAQPAATDYDAYGLKMGYQLPLLSISSMTSYLDYRNYGYLVSMSQDSAFRGRCTFRSSSLVWLRKS
jgi:hypothetical protein